MENFQLLPPQGTRMAVVGGCGGMGRVLVEAALLHGLKVAVLDLPRSLEQAPPPLEAIAIPCDVSEEASVQSAFLKLSQEWGALDVLVNLVGYTGERINIEDMTTQEWDSITDCGLRGMFLVARSAVPLIRAAGGGSIVLTASTFAHRVIHEGHGPYAAAKAGVIALAKALATECAPTIRVNAISPGVFKTPFLSGGMGRDQRVTGLDFEKYPQTVPLRRLGDPAEMVGPIMFLAGPASSYITGQTLHVNGGIWAP